LNRRDFLKLSGIGLTTIPFLKRKKKNNMTIHVHSFSDSGYLSGDSYYGFPHVGDTSTANYPGLVVGVSIFGSETVLGVTFQSEDLYLIRADTNGSYRSEIWVTGNVSSVVDGLIEISLTGMVDVVVGTCVYNYFGGVGVHDGATGTASPLIESFITPTQLYSILFGNLCLNAAAGGALTDQNPRWEVSGGSDNHGIGCDRGPLEDLNAEEMDYQTSGAAIWAASIVELLDYQDNPPAIMGSGM
jgi:hypothetical protein